MRVTQVLYSGLGGHGSVAFSILDGDSSHLTSQSFMFYGIEPTKEEYIQKCKEKNIPFNSVHIAGQFFLFSWISAFLNIVKQKPDVVLLHSTTLFALVPFLRLLGIKVIGIDHTPNASKPKQEWAAIYLLKYFASHMVFLTPSHFEEVKAKFGKNFYSPNKTSIINNGIDIQLFKPNENKKSPPPFNFGMQARFSNTKDFQTLIKAASILKTKKLPVPFKVSLAGDGDTYKSCNQLAVELNVCDVLEFKGMLNENQLLTLLNETHIYVHSSLSETMSTAIMQALSCGLTVIASDIPGNKSLIIDKENGLLFPTKNAEALANLLEDCILRKIDIEEYSIKARNFAELYLSMEAMFNKYYSIAKN